MSINRRPLRYAHSEGHTDLCYTEDGRQMITCGNDGDIRLWDGIDDTDPESYCVGEGAFSVAQKGDDIYVCRDDGRVTILKYPEGDRNGTLTRFTAPATHLVVAKNENIIACVSEDASVKVFNTPQDVDSTTFSDLTGPALGVAISPDENFLAASCGDGKIYIWNLKEKKLVKTIECVPRCNTFTTAKVLCRVSFDSKSKLMVYPNAREIVVMNLDQFQKLYSLKSSEVQANFSIVQFSPCGLYIAASTVHGDICIWRNQPDASAAISTHEQKYSVCALAWNPESNGEISFCDVNGQMGTLEYLSGSDNFVPQEIQEGNTALLEEDAEDEDNENAISLEKIKNETLGIQPSFFAAEGSTGSVSRPQSPERPISPPCTLQPPFQPGSSPVHLADRFMDFNDIGVVRFHQEEDDSSSIDVQFHDATHYKNLFMKNILGHTMASLSATVLALACETPSKLVCIPLKSGAKEWSSELTDLEEVLCVAASSSLVALASNVRMLRIFSVFGTQLAVLSIPGPVVSVTAFKKTVFVVYHACTAHSKDQNLAGMLVHVNDANISSRNLPIPITPQSTLMWIGFTDAGSLATYDSAGILRVCRVKSGAWIPSCDTSVHAKGASDSYFLVHVSETSQTLRVIHCKGAMYPATTPMPIVMELLMQVPLCEIETDKTQMEDKLFRWSHFETDQPEKAFKETAIKLFALACRNNLEDRAFELLDLLGTPQLINIALKYANKLGRTRLVERLSDLLRKLQGEDTTKNENNPNVSIRPVLNRTKKAEPIQPAKSQQIFTPELFSSNTSVNEEDSQLKEESVLLKPNNMKNPFLKNPSSEPKRNPLSLTNPSENFSKSDLTLKKTPPEKSAPVKNGGQNSKAVEKNDKESFSSWFNKQKPDLEAQHPEMEASDLVKFAMKLFKKQTEKRKATEEPEGSQKPKQSKLSAFAFSKQ